MHLNLSNYKTKALIGLILVLTYGIDQGVLCLIELIQKYDINLEVLRMPSNASLILGLLYLFDRKLWKFPIFNSLVTVPNLHGRYKGDLEYYHNNGGKLDCTIEVHQTASDIDIIGYFKNKKGEQSSSESKFVKISKQAGFYNIYYFYQNEGSTGDKHYAPHTGVNILKVIDSEGEISLNGWYFNDREGTPGRGTIEVKFKSKVLKGRL